MLHGHFDEAFLLGQKNIVGPRVGVKGFWGAANGYYHKVTTAPFGEWIAGTLFVRRDQACETRSD